MLSAIVVAYRSSGDVVECCKALLASNLISQVVVIDNSASEGWVSVVSELERLVTDRLVVVSALGNLGYARGNDIGMEIARAGGATHVLICNPDVVVDHAALDSLMTELCDGELALLSPQMQERGRSGDVVLRRPAWDLALGRGVVDTPRRWGYRPCFFGACWLADIRLFDAVGGLSDHLFLYGEEAELVERMRRMGRTDWAVSRAVVVLHARGASVSKDGYQMRRRSLVSVREPARSAIVLGRLYWPWLAPWWTAVRCLLALTYVLRGRPSLAAAVVSGVVSGWRVPLKGAEGPQSTLAGGGLAPVGARRGCMERNIRSESSCGTAGESAHDGQP